MCSNFVFYTYLCTFFLTCTWQKYVKRKSSKRGGGAVFANSPKSAENGPRTSFEMFLAELIFNKFENNILIYCIVELILRTLLIL